MTQEKYNSNRYGKATGLRFPPKDPVTGLYLAHGNGCHLHPNCFACKEPPDKCKYDLHSFRKAKLKRLGNVCT